MMDFIHADEDIICGFISAELADSAPAANARRSGRLESTLAHLVVTGVLLTYWRCRGCYKGTQERSFFVVGKRDDVNKWLRVLAGCYEQESVLVFTSDCAFLQFADDWTHHVECIGRPKWIPSKHAADDYDAYTIFDGFASRALIFE